MTSTASKYNPVLHNGRLNIKANTKISLIIFLLHLFGFPLLIISEMYNLSAGKSNEPDESFLFIAIGATAIAGIAGIIIAMVNFRYLYSKAQVDMCLAAPLSRKQRFLSDYLSGLVSYIAPFIITTIFSSILLLIGHFAYDGRSFPMYNEYGEISWVYDCEIFGETVPIFLTVVYVGILMMIMLYTITVLTACCCGSLFESVLYNIFINAAIPAVIYVVYMGTFENVLFGINAEPILLRAISVTSPLGGIVYLVANFSTGFYVESYSFSTQNISAPFWVIGFIIVTALMFALAYYLYGKRKAEQVSKPFVFRGLYVFTISLILIVAEQLCLAEGVLEGSELISWIIGTFCVYMLMEIVSNRGFKRIWVGIVRYAVTAGIFFGFTVLVDKTDCFGAVNKLPSSESIDSIVISTGGIYREYIQNEFRNINYIPDDLNKYGLYEIKSQENIERVRDIHRSVIERHNENDRIPVENFIKSEISICYVMKNGSLIVRNYDYGTIGADAAEAMAALTVSDELKNQAAEVFYASNLAHYDDLYELYRSHPKDTKPAFYMSYPFDDEHIKRFIDDKEFYIELNNAYRNDLKNISAEKYLNPAKSPYCNITSGYNMSFPGITSDHKETLAVLSENGLLQPRTDMEEILKSGAFDNIEIIILSPEDYTELANGAVYSSCVSVPLQYVHDSTLEVLHAGRYILEYSDELAEIMENVTDKYISDEPCYTIIIDGEKYKVPEEYSEAAARLYSTGSVSPTIIGDSSDTYSYKYYSIY